MQRHIVAAREEAERQSHHLLAAGELMLILDAWPGRVIEMPYPPLRSVTSIAYTDESGVTGAVDMADVIVDAYSTPGRIALKAGASWPGVTLQAIGGVRITFKAGFHEPLAVDATAPEIAAARALVPATARNAMLLMVGDWYEQREDTMTTGATFGKIGMAAGALLAQMRRKVTSPAVLG